MLSIFSQYLFRYLQDLTGTMPKLLLLSLFLPVIACGKRPALLPSPVPTDTPIVPRLLGAGGATPTLPSLENARVIDVLSGDTIIVRMDGVERPVSYLGVVAPKAGEPFFEEALALNQELVGGRVILLARDGPEVDGAEPAQRYVFRPDGVFANAVIVQQGLARPTSQGLAPTHQQLFQELAQEAAKNGRGLWSRP